MNGAQSNEPTALTSMQYGVYFSTIIFFNSSSVYLFSGFSIYIGTNRSQTYPVIFLNSSSSMARKVPYMVM